MPTTNEILAADIQKDEVITASGLFNDFAKSPEGTIYNEETLADLETDIYDAFIELGIPATERENIALEKNTASLYKTRRFLPKAQGLTLPNKINSTTDTPDPYDATPDEVYITLKAHEYLTRPFISSLEEMDRQDEMTRVMSLSPSAYHEWLIETKLNHEATLAQNRELTLLRSLNATWVQHNHTRDRTTSPYNTTNTTENKSFDGSFLNLSGVQQLNTSLFFQIIRKLKLGNKLSRNAKPKIMFFGTQEMLDKILEEIATDPIAQSQLLMNAMQVQEMINLANNMKNINPANLQSKSLIMAEKYAYRFDFKNGIIFHVLRYHFVEELWNSVDGRYRLGFVMTEAFAKIDNLQPTDIRGMTRIPNIHRDFMPCVKNLGYFVHTTHFNDAKMIDCTSVRATAKFSIVPSGHWDKAGFIEIEPSSYYTGNITDLRNNVYKPVYDDFIARIRQQI